MKKLILLFSAILISGFFSAQSADGTYSKSYGRCFEKEAGEWPKKIPMVSDWQSKNEVITNSRIGFNGNGVQISSGGNVSSTDGCPQGKIDGIAYRNSSKNNEDKSKKKK